MVIIMKLRFLNFLILLTLVINGLNATKEIPSATYDLLLKMPLLLKVPAKNEPKFKEVVLAGKDLEDVIQELNELANKEIDAEAKVKYLACLENLKRSNFKIIVHKTI